MALRMPLSLEAAVDVARGLVALFESEVMVEVDDVRLNVFASGARCVSLSSVGMSEGA